MSTAWLCDVISSILYPSATSVALRAAATACRSVALSGATRSVVVTPVSPLVVDVSFEPSPRSSSSLTFGTVPSTSYVLAGWFGLSRRASLSRSTPLIPYLPRVISWLSICSAGLISQSYSGRVVCSFLSSISAARSVNPL